MLGGRSIPPNRPFGSPGPYHSRATRVVAAHMVKERSAVPLLFLAWTRLGRLASRFAALVAAVRSGRLPVPPGPRLRDAPDLIYPGWRAYLSHIGYPASLAGCSGWSRGRPPMPGRCGACWPTRRWRRCWPGRHRPATSCARFAGCWASNPSPGFCGGGASRRPGAGCGPRLSVGPASAMRPRPARGLWMRFSGQARNLRPLRPRERGCRAERLSTPGPTRRLCPGAELNRAERPASRRIRDVATAQLCCAKPAREVTDTHARDDPAGVC